VKRCLSRMSGKLSRTVLRRGKGSNPFSLVEYTSFRFRKLLRRNKVRQSFSAAGCPYDNAVSESFFKHFKFEQVYPNYFPNYNSFKEAIHEYVDFFNNKRPHHTLKNKIPNHYEEEYFSKIS
jgi:putative transposase